MNQDMWKIIRVAQVAVVTLLLTVSCTKDPTDGGGSYDKEYVDFTMELQPPGDYTPTETRAMVDDAQNAINRATVLVYNSTDQLLIYYKEGTVKDNKLTVKLKTSQKESDVFDIVVIGNSPDFTPTVGRTKAELQAALTDNVSGKWTGKEFMMWGERKKNLITPFTNNFKIEMLRSLARVDIGAGGYNQASETWEGLTDFVLTEVRVVNSRNKFAVIPLPANITTEDKVKVSAPTIPEGTTVQGKTADDALKYSGDDIQNGTIKKHGAYINSTIFVAEAPTTPDNEGVTLIIGGTYKGVESYYRVDFRVPKTVGEDYDYLPILRNHRYRITITEILAAGATTAEQALASTPMDNIIRTTLDPISESENGGDIVFDSNNYIKTDVSDVRIHGICDGKKRYDIFTVKAGTKAGASTIGTVTGPGISGSLALTNGVSQLVTVPVSGESSSTYTITVGKLTKKINVYCSQPVTGMSGCFSFTNVADITTSSSWLTLSHNITYVPSEQKSGFISGGAYGETYIHLPVNTSDGSRFAEAIVTYRTGQCSTRIMIEQKKTDSEIIGYFGGDPETTQGKSLMYPKQLVLGSSQSVLLYCLYMAPYVPPYTSPFYGWKANAGIAYLENFPALAYCASLNYDTNDNGILESNETIWYLPAKNQLLAMWVFQGGMVAPLAPAEYWSNTGVDSRNPVVWQVNFLSGRTNGTYWTDRFYVRCVKDL